MVGDRLDFDIYPANKLGMKTLQGTAWLQRPKNSDYVPMITFETIEGLSKMLCQKQLGMDDLSRGNGNK